MSKKHFIQLAAMFKDNRPGENWDANKLIMWNALVSGAARVCKQANPAFDYARFVAACGGLFDMDRSAP